MGSRLAVAVGTAAVLLASCGDNRTAPLADASPSDASIDAEPVDAPPALFHPSVTSLDLGTLPVGGPASTVSVAIALDAAAPIHLEVTTTGPFLVTASTCQQSLATTGCSFVPVLTTPHALGPVTGTIELASGTTHVTIPITATAAGYIVGTANGSGHVTASPVSAGCDGCYAPGTLVTLTANADEGTPFVAWSDPACKGATTCVYTAGLAPHVSAAAFALDSVPFEVDFIGNAPGDVRVIAGNTEASCTASCVVAVPAGQGLTVDGATPATDVGFGAPCSAISDCFPDAGTASITVDYELVPTEVEIPLPDADTYSAHSVEFDPAGELLTGGDAVRVLTASYATKWTAPFAGPAHFAANGDVVVVAAGAVTKLAAADGSVLWSQPTTTLKGYGVTNETTHGFAVTPSGGVVLSHDSTMVELWDPTGTTLTQIPTASTSLCVGAGPGDKIYVGVQSLIFPDDEIDYEVFDSTGAHLLPDSSRVENSTDDSGPDCSSIAATADTVFASFLDPGAIPEPTVGIDHFGSDGAVTHDIGFVASDIEDERLMIRNLVAVNDSDEVATARDQNPNNTDVPGLVLTKYDATLTAVWSLSRPGISEDIDRDVLYGLAVLADLAVAPDGRIAVIYRYYGYAGAYWVVEIFQP